MGYMAVWFQPFHRQILRNSGFQAESRFYHISLLWPAGFAGADKLIHEIIAQTLQCLYRLMVSLSPLQSRPVSIRAAREPL